MELLLDAGADVSVKGGFYDHALHAAARSGSVLSDELIHGKVEADAYGGPIAWKPESLAKGGVEAGFERLLEKRMPDSRSHVATTELLLERGADVNVTGGFYASALQAAACSGNVGLVKLLLDSGADCNIQGGLHGTALKAAVYWAKMRLFDFSWIMAPTLTATQRALLAAPRCM